MPGMRSRVRRASPDHFARNGVPDPGPTHGQWRIGLGRSHACVRRTGLGSDRRRRSAGGLGAILIGVAAIKRLGQIASFTRDWHHVLRITTDPGRAQHHRHNFAGVADFVAPHEAVLLDYVPRIRRDFGRKNSARSSIPILADPGASSGSCCCNPQLRYRSLWSISESIA